MKIPKNDGDDDALAYFKVVKAELQYNRREYNEFLKLPKYFMVGRICLSPEKYDEYLNCVKARVKELLRGHTHLILGFNIFLPKEHQFTLPAKKVKKVEENCEVPLDKGKKVKKVEENSEVPLDVLDIISKTLDFDDHFQFAGVCENWRAFHKIYWRNFLASQEPLLLRISYHAKRSYSFISIPGQKVYHLEMMKYFNRFTYLTSSSGYFIMVGHDNNSFMLINPFTRIKKVINSPTIDVYSFINYRALLAFGKCSEEFVLVVLCKQHLHVYQSRNCGWVTYLTTENSGRVVDFVVLHNIIYVVTKKGHIGVLNLNSANIRFLQLKNTPDVTFSFYLRLVNCDEQLLVVDLLSDEISNVYKIDFLTMSYVKLETLADIALLYRSNGNCYALSNPNKWGYESNSMYVTSLLSTKCRVYSGDDKKLQKCITLPGPHGTNSITTDWCFRHLQYEVDYSLVE